MPLLDYFRPPLSRTHPWRGFHGAWAAAIARLLNGGDLPEGYYAVPFLDRDGPFEIDIATLEDVKSRNGDAAESSGWQPDSAGISVAVEWPEVDDIHVEVLRDDGDPKLAAAIEMVTLSNKDRPRVRAAFVEKCCDTLRRGCGLVVIDVVTTRRADLSGDIFRSLDAEPPAAAIGELSAISFRPMIQRLMTWPESLRIGLALPTLPLWLTGDVVDRRSRRPSQSRSEPYRGLHRKNRAALLAITIWLPDSSQHHALR